MGINTKLYIEKYLKIVDKNAKLIPFIFTALQNKIYDAIKSQAIANKPIRIITLKCRQLGASTFGTGVCFKISATSTNSHCGIITHKADTTDNLNKMCQNYYNNLPDPLKPQKKAFNDREISFSDLNSSMSFMTAGSGDGVGVGETFNILHISELSRWQWAKETLLPILQTVPMTPDSVVYIESTARGYDYFKELWDSAVKGESDFLPVFCAWWEVEEYQRDGIILEYDEEECYLKERFNLNDRQLSWRRWCIANNCGGDIDMFHQDYPSYPEEAFLSSGECVFDLPKLNKRLSEVTKPIRKGKFEYTKELHEVKDFGGQIVDVQTTIKDIKFVDEPNGMISIYKEPYYFEDNFKIVTHPYVIGGDTAGTGIDFYTAKVLDNTNEECVATLHKQRIDDDLYSEQVYCLGMYYNQALIGLEINFSVVPTRHLKDIGYPNLYRTEVIDSITNKSRMEYGWKTTKISKDAMVKGLIIKFRESPYLECDYDTLTEMTTYVRDEKGSYNAMTGCHDDLVIASAIAHFISNSHLNTEIVEKKKSTLPRFFQEDNYEDDNETNLFEF